MSQNINIRESQLSTDGKLDYQKVLAAFCSRPFVHEVFVVPHHFKYFQRPFNNGDKSQVYTGNDWRNILVVTTNGPARCSVFERFNDERVRMLAVRETRQHFLYKADKKWVTHYGDDFDDCPDDWWEEEQEWVKIIALILDYAGPKLCEIPARCPINNALIVSRFGNHYGVSMDKGGIIVCVVCIESKSENTYWFIRKVTIADLMAHSGSTNHFYNVAKWEHINNQFKNRSVCPRYQKRSPSIHKWNFAKK